MFNDSDTFMSLSALASRISLPRSYLKTLADKRAIPFLDVNGHRRFNAEAVDIALANLAAGEKENVKGANDARN